MGHLHEGRAGAGFQLCKGPGGQSYVLSAVVIHPPHHIVLYTPQ